MAITDPDVNIANENPIKIFRRACPLIILAKRRIAKLKTRAKYDISSITIRKGTIASGVPDGRNKLNISHFKLNTPKRLIKIKKVLAKKNVTIKELVKVKANGAKPLKLDINMNMNTYITGIKKYCRVIAKFSRCSEPTKLSKPWKTRSRTVRTRKLYTVWIKKTTNTTKNAIIAILLITHSAVVTSNCSSGFVRYDFSVNINLVTEDDLLVNWHGNCNRPY